jgi:hypothetical protein
MKTVHPGYPGHHKKANSGRTRQTAGINFLIRENYQFIQEKGRVIFYFHTH